MLRLIKTLGVPMEKNTIKNRVMMDFINAADHIIMQEGIDKVTLRKVSTKAGYNSATLYNYFENLDHLVFFAAMGLIKDYANALETYVQDSKNAMDRFLMVWECFCDYAFDKPEVYNALFFPKLDKDMEEYVQQYYSLFPNDLRSTDKTISTMLLKSDITSRGMTTIKDCVEEGYIRKDDSETLNELTLMIFEGILKKVLSGKISYEEARNKTMYYIKSIVKGMLIKEYQFYY